MTLAGSGGVVCGPTRSSGGVACGPTRSSGGVACGPAIGLVTRVLGGVEWALSTQLLELQPLGSGVTRAPVLAGSGVGVSYVWAMCGFGRRWGASCVEITQCVVRMYHDPAGGICGGVTGDDAPGDAMPGERERSPGEGVCRVAHPGEGE